MRKIIVVFLFLLIFFSLAAEKYSYNPASSLLYKQVLIEDFDNFPPEIGGWIYWDENPDEWEITDDFGNNGSMASLHLYGSTAKTMEFYPIPVDSGDVWQIAAYIESVGDTIGIGFCDQFHTLFYSIAGNACLDIDKWVTCNQGIYQNQQWHEINFPVADDWQARFDYLPKLEQIIFVNNCDSHGEVYFDDIKNISRLLPQAPAAGINYEVLSERVLRDGMREVTASFSAEVEDADSQEFSYYWQMGDSTVVEESEFEYTYTITDDHPYSISLRVTDDTGLEGFASRQIELESGAGSFPLTVNFTGDIILARGIEEIIYDDGYEVLFDPTLELLGNAADITVVNLECPLTDSETHHPTKSIYFKGTEANAAALPYAGIDVVTLANNHILDYMEEGIIDTQAALDSLGILHSGAGLNSYEAYRPLILNRKGVNLSFLASSDRTGQYNNYQPYLNAGYDKSGFAYLTPYYMQKQINEVRNVSDLVIMELHCGSEYSTEPGSNYDSLPDDWYIESDLEDENYSWRLDVPQAWDMEYRHFAIDAGADLVICHHPHIMQGLEVYNGKLIAHSLGNFIFDLSYTETFPTGILYSEIGESGFERFYLKPCYIDDNITKPATGELGIFLLDHIAHKSRELGSYLYVDKEEMLAEVVMDTLNMQVYSTGFVENTILEERDGYYTTGPIKLRRIGSIASLSSITTAGNWEFRVGREIIYHGNFEDEGCSEWNINSSHEWLSQEEPYMGENCLCIELDDSAGDNIITNLEGRIKLYDDADYSLHGYIRTDNTEDAEVQIRTYSSRTQGDYINMYGTPSLDGDNEWTFVWQDLPELSDDARYIDYRSTIYPPESGQSYGYFDNVGLIGWDEWQPYNGSSVEIMSPNEYYYIELRSTDASDAVRWTYTENSYGFLPLYEEPWDASTMPSAVLMPNYPNPFNPQTSFNFALYAPAETAEICVYNIKGQKVKSLPVDISNGAGSYSAIWEGDNNSGEKAGSGVYLYRLKIDGAAVSAGKCILLK